MAKIKIELTKEKLKALFEYREGELYWKIKPCIRMSIGDKVSASQNDTFNHKKVCLHGHSYKVHRLIWIMFNGDIPKGLILDHKDRNRQNNRIENLRLATNSQNRANSSYMKNTKSGFKGVRKRRYGWEAVIGFIGTKKYLGNFRTAELAKEAYNKAAIELYGDFASF